MSLNFEDQQIQRPRYDKGVPNGSKLTNFVIRIGLAKTEDRANQILLLSAIIFFLLSIILFFTYVKSNIKDQKVTYKFSQDLVKKFPQNIQVKLLQQ